MEYKESVEIVIRDCKFLLGLDDLRRLLPGIEDHVPPFTAIRFADGQAPRFVWGFPTVHGPRLLWSLQQFITREMSRCLASAAYQENLRLLTPVELRQDTYFQLLSEALLKTLAEGSFLKLDSILWIYLSDIICRRLNQDEETDRLLFRHNQDEFRKLQNIDPVLARMRFKDPRRFVDIRVKVLRSLFARNDFANSSMKEVFEEVPQNPLNREMINNRLIYTERPEAIYRALDVNEAFLVKGYKFTSIDFTGINRLLRMVIAGILSRVGSSKQLALDIYFLETFVTPEARQKLAGLPSQLAEAGDRHAPTRELLQADNREKLALLLSMHEAPSRFLLYHLCLEDRDYLRPIERNGTIPSEIIKAIRNRSSAIIFEGLYNEVTRDLLRWDFLQSLRSRLRWVTRKGEKAYVDGRHLSYSTVPLDLESYHEVYRRSRYGTAVFFDLVGFTNRTKALTRDLQAAAKRGDKERYDLSSISLAIQRIFSIRHSLDAFGGIPQGFEGDAILDMFPRALNALRYVTTFVDNYTKNQMIRFKPFERPVENPYKDGYRVGLASGDYSIISIVGRSNEYIGEKTLERAVGHTINRASRLNSGKKGEAFLLLEEEGGEAVSIHDPFGLFKVHISHKKELNNDGIASFEDTFLELREQIVEENLPWFEPAKLRGTKIAGVTPIFQNYHFELIFEDAKVNRVFCIRRLEKVPELKGLEDEDIKVFEYLLFEPEEFLALMARDKELGAPQTSISLADMEDDRESPYLVMNHEEELDPVEGIYDWEDMVDHEAAKLQLEHGISLSDLKRGQDGVRFAVERHSLALDTWAKRQLDGELPEDHVLDPDIDAREALGLGTEDSDQLLANASSSFLDQKGSVSDETAVSEHDRMEARENQLAQRATFVGAGSPKPVEDELARDAQGPSLQEMLAWSPDDDLANDLTDQGQGPMAAHGTDVFARSLGTQQVMTFSTGEKEDRSFEIAVEDGVEAEDPPEELETDGLESMALPRKEPFAILSENVAWPDIGGEDGSDRQQTSREGASQEFNEVHTQPFVPRSSEATATHSRLPSGARAAASEVGERGRGEAIDGHQPVGPEDVDDVEGPTVELSAPSALSLQDAGDVMEIIIEAESGDETLEVAIPEADRSRAAEGVIHLEWSNAAEIKALYEEVVLDQGRGLSGEESGPEATNQSLDGVYSVLSPGRRVGAIQGRTEPTGSQFPRSPVPDLSILYQGYMYAIEQPVGAATARVIIGQAVAGRLTDVNVFRTTRLPGQPWQLDTVLGEFLTQKRDTSYEKSEISWMIVEPLASNLVPIPIAHLERIYRRLFC